MSYKLLIFPEVLNAKCTLQRMDDGLVILGKPDVDPGGRKGQSFEIPDDTTNGHGAIIVVDTVEWTSEDRGILYLRVAGFQFPWMHESETAAFRKDDYRAPTLKHKGRSGPVRLV